MLRADRQVIDLPPAEGYLAREIQRLPKSGPIQPGDEIVVVRDGKALQGNVRDLVEAARRGIDNLIMESSRLNSGSGGGGRHTYENAVARAPDAGVFTGTEEVLIVRGGRTYAAPAAALSRTFVLSIPITGKPSNLEDIECHLFVDNVNFPANFSGSLAKSAVASTSSKVFSILRNEVQVATVTFGAGQTTGTFAMASPLAVLVGQNIDLLCPATADATLADIKITLRGTVA
jgi:hypothetical protein